MSIPIRDKPEKEIFDQSVRITIFFILVLWVIHAALWVFNIPSGVFGIMPRTVRGLLGILTGPLVHGDIFHLISNSVPLLILGVGFLYFYNKLALEVFVWIYLTTGFWVWLLARESWHIGASGLIYGIATFIFVSGIIRKNKRLLSLALIVLLLYGGFVYGLFPEKSRPEVSWESHLLGSISGLVLAIYFRKRKVITDTSEELDSEEIQDNKKAGGLKVSEKEYFSSPDGTKSGTYSYKYRHNNQKE